MSVGTGGELEFAFDSVPVAFTAGGCWIEPWSFYLFAGRLSGDTFHLVQRLLDGE